MTGDEESQPLLCPTNSEQPGRSNKDNPNTLFKEEVTWRSESGLVARQSLPLICTYLLQYFYILMIVVVCSQLSTEELAASSIGTTTMNITGIALIEGMVTALDPLCAQAYGAGNAQLVGIHMLRFIIFIHLVCAMIGTLWLFSPLILPHLVPSAELAMYGSTFLQWAVLGLPGYASFEAGKRFLQAQGNFTAGLVVLIACLPLNLLLNWLLVFHFDLRIAGASIAVSLTNLIRPLLLIAYVRFIAPHTLQCWPSPFPWRALWTNWKPMVNLAIPSAIMALSEWMAFEILTFATSYAGTVALAAQTFLGTGAIVVWHLHFATSVVTSTRLGHLIGAGQLRTAKKVSAYYVFDFLVVGVIDMLLMFGLMQAIVQFLDMEQTVRIEVMAATPLAVLFTFFDCMATCMHGTIRGLGWQSIGGWVTVLCNYGYGVPLALVLELGPPSLGVRGLWMAITSGLALIALVEGLVLKVRSWNRVTEDATRRQQS